MLVLNAVRPQVPNSGNRSRIGAVESPTPLRLRSPKVPLPDRVRGSSQPPPNAPPPYPETHRIAPKLSDLSGALLPLTGPHASGVAEDKPRKDTALSGRAGSRTTKGFVVLPDRRLHGTRDQPVSDRDTSLSGGQKACCRARITMTVSGRPST